MDTADVSCRFCQGDIRPSSTRCKHCGSWLDVKAHVFYPETLWVVLSLIITLVATVAATFQAADARGERRATEQLRNETEQLRNETKELRNEISSVAANVTKMAYVVADGSSRWDGFPPQHLEVIKTYQAAMTAVLPADLEKEIASTLNDLEQKIRSNVKPDR